MPFAAFDMQLDLGRAMTPEQKRCASQALRDSARAFKAAWIGCSRRARRVGM